MLVIRLLLYGTSLYVSDNIRVDPPVYYGLALPYPYFSTTSVLAYGSYLLAGEIVKVAPSIMIKDSQHRDSISIISRGNKDNGNDNDKDNDRRIFGRGPR